MLKRTLLLSVLIVCAAALVTPAMAQDDNPVVSVPVIRKTGDVKALEKRVKNLEAIIIHRQENPNWYDRIKISGLLEVQAGYGKTDFEDPLIDDETSSDVNLTNIELVLDADIANSQIAQTNGHLMVKYSDDDLFIDEGYIAITGNRFPFYFIAGRQYVPFGNFDSHFISDPQTLVLGETSGGAAVAGFRPGDSDLLDISVGVFNGKAREVDDDNTINSLVASVKTTPVADLSMGISYTSNIASANAINDSQEPGGDLILDSLVAGWSAFVSYNFLDRFHLIGEFVGAMDDFKPDELPMLGTKPSGWNIELSVSITDSTEFATRYGGSDDGGELLPESEYGAIVNWTLFDNTNLGLEYIHGKFEDDLKKTDSYIAHLSIEF